VQKKNAITKVITLDKDIGFIEYAVSKNTYSVGVSANKIE
jgi:hypothetical protein